jgi:SAM-dependent methyltransferase
MKELVRLYGDEWSAEVYDCQVKSVGDLPFWQGLAESADGPALELACGTGRLLLPLARAGFSVTGLDASRFMLAVARRKLAQEDHEVRARCRLVDGNMSRFALEERFGLICIPARSFQILPTRDEQRSCLECCARHLRPEGRLAIDVFNPRLDLLISPKGHRVGPTEFEGPDGASIVHESHTQYDRASQALTAAWWYVARDEEGTATRHDYRLEMRYLFRFGMEWMLEACGFEVEVLYGNFDRSEFAADSPELIFVARRAT